MEGALSVITTKCKHVIQDCVLDCKVFVKDMIRLEQNLSRTY